MAGNGHPAKEHPDKDGNPSVTLPFVIRGKETLKNIVFPGESGTNRAMTFFFSLFSVDLLTPAWPFRLSIPCHFTHLCGCSELNQLLVQCIPFLGQGCRCGVQQKESQGEFSGNPGSK